MNSLRTVFFLFTLNFWIFNNAFADGRLKGSDPLPANLFVELAKKVNPSVVNIFTTSMAAPSRGGMPSGDPFFDMFQQFMGPNMQQRPEAQRSLGTGFIIRKDGLIITNNHVVESADVIRVQLSEQDKETYKATIIGRDARTDVALIKISVSRELPAVKLGTSSDLEVGEWVAAFGNPFGHGHTMTKGIVSALGRAIDELNKFPFIQTDASINPGNSGGPLVNTAGEVIAINTAIDGRAQGIGFAIPIDNVKSILPALEKDGGIRRAFMGVAMYPYAIDPRALQELKLPTTEGALLTEVVPGSPAEKAGLKKYDFIVKMNGQKVVSNKDFLRMVGDSAVGETKTVDFYRDGKLRKAQVTLEGHPDDKQEKTNRVAKSYRGQKAPFGLGFTVANYSRELAREMGLPPLKQSLPIVVNIEPDGPAAEAGLSMGDVIRDVNRTAVTSDTDVIKLLRKDKVNFLLVWRGNYEQLIAINPKE